MSTTPKRRGGVRIWTERSAALAAGLVLAVLAAEVTVRWTKRDPLHGGFQVGIADGWNGACTRLVPGHGYELLPDRCGANELGLRDRPGVGERQDGELRIIALGDSISADGAWTEILELMLSDATQRPVQVLNLGVPGYSIFNELELYRSRGESLDADAVVLQVCLNDYFPTPVFMQVGDTLLRVEDASGGLARLNRTLFERSALYRFYLYQSIRLDSDSFQLRAAAGDRALDELIALTQARGQPLAVAVFPHLGPVGVNMPEQRETAQHVAELVASRGTPHLDLRDRFEAVGFVQLRLPAGPAAWAGLEATVAKLGLPAEAAALLRGVEHDQLQLSSGGIDDPMDLVHPNFLGHYIAAQSMSDWLMGDPSWAQLLVASSEPAPVGM